MRLFLCFSVLMCLLSVVACAAGQPPAAPDAPPEPPPQPATAPPAPTPPPEPTPTPLPSTPTPSPATATLVPGVSSGSYEPAECQFTPPRDIEVACGYLRVPENRADPQSQTIRLHVAVFASTSPTPAPDPLVYLDGGPGSNPLELVPLVFERWFEPLLASRDLIIFDQRGTGYSEPALDCTEMVDLGFELLDQDMSRAEANARYVEAASQCRRRLQAEGIDLSAYTSTASAADLDDLRQALGYEQWNLYGISYGTRLALTAMRDYPDGIRSVVLDSVYPPQAAESDIPANAQRSFDLLFAACADNAECAEAFPNLEAAFYETVARLEEEPVTVNVTNMFTGQSHDVLLDGEALISTLFQMLYVSGYLPILPDVLYDAYEDGYYSILAEEAAFQLFTADFFSDGLYFSIQCQEEILFNTREELTSADADFPQLQDVFDGDGVWDICTAWEATRADSLENQPVSSPIPTLILSGYFDPITPPAYGAAVAETLPNSFAFTFSTLSHGVAIDHACPRQLQLAFLDEPTSEPDAGCIEQMEPIDFTGTE